MNGLNSMSNDDLDLEDFNNEFKQAMDLLKQEEEDYWNSLSTNDQLKAFCAVVRRLVEGDIKQRGTYRYVLYQVFGFGTDAYARAQNAGYLALHNSIMSYEEEEKYNALVDMFVEIAKLTHDHKVVDDQAVVSAADLGQALSKVSPDWVNTIKKEIKCVV